MPDATAEQSFSRIKRVFKPIFTWVSSYFIDSELGSACGSGPVRYLSQIIVDLQNLTPLLTEANQRYGDRGAKPISLYTSRFAPKSVTNERS